MECFFCIMTGANLSLLVREYTRTNSTTLPDSKIVLLGNVVKDDFAKEIMKADEDIFGVPATRSLVASATSREYSLPDDLLKMIRVEALFDGTNWVHLKELNLVQYKRTTDEATIISKFSNSYGNAFYDIFRKALWIYSSTITAVTDGLKLYYIAYPADIAVGDLAGSTDLSLDPTATTSQLPRQFHELWARKISIMWKSAREKPIPLTERELAFNIDFTKAIEAITNPNQDRENLAELPDDTKYQL